MFTIPLFLVLSWAPFRGCLVFVAVIAWVQVLVCRFGRRADHRLLFEDAEHETSSMGDYPSIQVTDYHRSTLQQQQQQPRKTTPIAPQQRRRYGRETEPLLPADSLSKSVSIAVVPSVPQEPALKTFAQVAGIGGVSEGDAKAEKQLPLSSLTTLPPTSQLSTLMQSSLPTKTYIRSLKQISNAFTLRDVLAWLKTTFSGVSDLDESTARTLVLSLLESGQIIAGTSLNASPSQIELDNALFIFPLRVENFELI